MSSFSPPPRFVPTLTEVVEQTPMLVPTAGNVDSANLAVAELEDQLLHRLMQRIDLILERRLREAVGQLILEHTETLAPRLREEIEAVVRQSVSQAFAQEVANTPFRS